jgi:3',5'-cyclic AMP phosphodiesterase CpdA
MTGITRREALISGAAALLAAGCGATGQRPTPSGSTLDTTWVDPTGVGVLTIGSGESLIPRTELAQASTITGHIATIAHVTDAHVLDASSPARVTFLDRLGPPFQSTFRPHETLTTQVLAGALNSINRLRPDAVIQGGDLIDNAQANELAQGLAILRGGLVRPGSGPRGYHGVQLASDPDPFYYRPDLDAPRYPGLLHRATRAFVSRGLGGFAGAGGFGGERGVRGIKTYPVLGDHDILVQGEIPPTAETNALALGDQAVWESPPGLRLPPGTQLTTNGSPDGPLIPSLVSNFLAQALAGTKVQVPADPSRRQMTAGQVVAALNARGATLDYTVDLTPQLKLIILDLARRDGGSGGLVRTGQPAWVERELAAAAGRWVMVVSHQPLTSSENGDAITALLDQSPNVIATLAGHTHRNRITPRQSQTGGYWMIETASLIDCPQQARAIRIAATEKGIAIQTWMLDHTFPGDLGTISRRLAYLDAQGGRPGGFAGSRLDRNVTLYLGG